VARFKLLNYKVGDIGIQFACCDLRQAGQEALIMFVGSTNRAVALGRNVEDRGKYLFTR